MNQNEEQELRGLRVMINNLETLEAQCQLDEGASKQLEACKARLQELQVYELPEVREV